MPRGVRRIPEADLNGPPGAPAGAFREESSAFNTRKPTLYRPGARSPHNIDLAENACAEITTSCKANRAFNMRGLAVNRSLPMNFSAI